MTTIFNLFVEEEFQNTLNKIMNIKLKLCQFFKYNNFYISYWEKDKNITKNNLHVERRFESFKPFNNVTDYQKKNAQNI